jgi:hypothetical protein
MDETALPATDLAVQAVVPYLHVEDVARSIAFYRHLGFIPDMVLQPPPQHGTPARPFWASIVSGAAKIFFAQASGPIDPTQQAALLYLYASDVRALRRHLLTAAVTDGGPFGPTQKATWSTSGVAYDVTAPPHMPRGELRLHDPDGYCLLIGQKG